NFIATGSTLTLTAKFFWTLYYFGFSALLVVRKSAVPTIAIVVAIGELISTIVIIIKVNEGPVNFFHPILVLVILKPAVWIGYFATSKRVEVYYRKKLFASAFGNFKKLVFKEKRIMSQCSVSGCGGELFRVQFNYLGYLAVILGLGILFFLPVGELQAGGPVFSFVVLLWAFVMYTRYAYGFAGRGIVKCGSCSRMFYAGLGTYRIKKQFIFMTIPRR
ncbi:MAG: hypothetical protein ACKN97_04090, partial [Acidobacteriota bacterium]